MSEAFEYQSLYRRFRPQRFEEVLGQQHVTRALRNAVATGTVSHAYLFSGPRGTGKTSTARILAKALNCEAPEQGEPCCRCNSCSLVRDGRSYDVEELDAASNSGVDAMRTLISTVSTSSFGTWKIYIVDEVHMLSTAASNALLKTLEEPPPHVVFVLATTSPQKILQTIISRTQHFEFKLLDDEILDALLSSVDERAELGLDAESLAWARRRGSGSARDTLSFLDQAVALGGKPDDDEGEIDKLVRSLLAGDVAEMIALVDRLVSRGVEANQIAIEILQVIRDAFLFRVAGLHAERPGRRVLEVLEVEGVLVATSELTRVMESLGRATLELREGIDPVTVLQAVLVGLVPMGDRARAVPEQPTSMSPDHRVHDQLLEDRLRLLETEVRELRELLGARSSSASTPVSSNDGNSGVRGLESIRRGLGGATKRLERAEREETTRPGKDSTSGNPGTVGPSTTSAVDSSVGQTPGATASETGDAADNSAPRTATDSLSHGASGGVARPLDAAEGPRPEPKVVQVKSDRVDDALVAQNHLDRAVEPRAQQSDSTLGLASQGSSQSRVSSDAGSVVDPPPSDTMESTDEGLVELERLQDAWVTAICPSLPLRIRSKYQTSRVVAVVGTKVTLGFENSFYLDLTRPLRRDVEIAMASYLGLSEIALDLVVVDLHNLRDNRDESPDEELNEMSEFANSDNVSTEETVATMIERVFPGARELD